MLFFTTEIAEGSGRNGMRQPTPPENATDYTPFSPLAIKCVPLRLHLPMAKKPKSVAPRLKECERKVLGERRCQLRGIAKRQSRQGWFRLHSFARSVADLGFSPDGNWSRLEAQEWEWARNRIIGHEFRTGARTVARTDCLIPCFPPLSVSSVVKTLPLISALSVVKDTTRDDLTTKTPKKQNMKPLP